MKPIAVIGLSCLFPEADKPKQFWENLLQDKNSCTIAIEENLEADPLRYTADKKGISDKFYSSRGGYIRNFSMDPEGFQLPPETINQLGPTFQWPLYTAREALLDSGYLKRTEVLEKCGLVLGNLSFPTRESNHLVLPIYQKALQKLMREALGRPEFSLHPFLDKKDVAWENSHISGLPASIIAQCLGLSSCRFAIDSACASSLYAVALACNYLSGEQTDMMLAGAVSAADPFFVNMGFSIFQAYPEPDEKSNPLDNNSRGLYASQGAGMFVLKRLSDAERDGDKIQAVISGAGLSNDGRGQFVLSPNSKGQLLAFERAYSSVGVEKGQIDYIECHATGTPLGDKVELDSMEKFFASELTVEKRKTKPLIGSVKSNLGHMLTAAGMGGMTKVILALQQGKIPATVGVMEPMSSKNSGISSKQIVQQAIEWPHKKSERRAAVSAFGFGGTNAHIVFETGKKRDRKSRHKKQSLKKTQLPMAIVGMEAIFGGCNGLNEFYQTVYDNKQHFRSLPPDRWKGMEQYTELFELPKGAWLKSFDIDFLRFKLQPNPKEHLISQQLLTLAVTDKAIKSTKIKEGQNVAVLVAMETELEIHRFRGRVNLSTQIEDSLKEAGINMSEAEQHQLIEACKDSISEEVPINRFTSFIGNIMASRISSLWDFSGPAFTVSSEENSVSRSLEIAQMLLDSQTVEAVVITAVDLAGSPEQVILRQREIPLNTGKPTLSFDKRVNGWMIGEGAGSVILKRMDAAKKDKEKIYATIDSIAFSRATSSENFEECVKKAMKFAGIKPDQIGLLEVCGSGNSSYDKLEMEGLNRAFSGVKPHCAIGSVKANIGHTFAASGMASLIKTALCLYHRFIPGVPQWESPKTEINTRNIFYVPEESRPWLIQPGMTKRFAGIDIIGQDQVCSNVILSEVPTELRKKIEIAEPGGVRLFILPGQEMTEIKKGLKDLGNDLNSGQDLVSTAHHYYRQYKKNNSKFAAVLLGSSRDELQKEIEAAKSGIDVSFSGNGDWRTPRGSNFSASPLSREGKVAFTYPGGFSAYVHCGRSLFQMYPGLHQLDEELMKQTGPSDKRQGSNYLSMLLQEERLFPRTLNCLSDNQLNELQEDFFNTPIAMFESGVSSAVLNTHVMRKGFGLEPDIAFGYSMGEISMLYGLGVWESMCNMSHVLNTSSLFKDRLAGQMNAVRESWNLKSNEFHDEQLWNCYSIKLPATEVQAVVDMEPHAYLILINTPRESVIAGEPAACLRIIEILGEKPTPIPVTDVVHCDPVKTEYEEIKRVHTDKVIECPDIDFYSAIDYEISKLDSETLANNIATIYGKTVDYTRLINKVYQDGARIFVDLGPRTTCSKWISETLGDKPNLSISINRKGTDNRLMILQALSSLISHRVSVNLDPLFPDVPTQPEKQLMQTINLGGKNIQQIFAEGIEGINFGAEKNIQSDNFSKPQPVSDLLHVSASSSRSAVEMQIKPQNSNPPIHSQKLMEPFQDSSTSELSALSISSIAGFPGDFGSRRNSAHSAFLNLRKNGMKQIAGIISSLMRDYTPISSDQDKTVNKINLHSPEQSLDAKTEHKPLIFNYQDLKEIAGGSISRVFGADYKPIDSYRRCVRLPMEPYLLVSRVTKLDGKLGEFKPSTVTTEYDIPHKAWYTTDGNIPWAVAVESGQCDLLLISYLGIDFECKGEKVYRLLDCTLTFLEDMPREGETLRYEISINSFARHDQNLLFFFNYECFVGNKMVLRMDNGCAGFFSNDELAQGKGVIHTEQEKEVKNNAEKIHFPQLISCPKSSFTRSELLEISAGNPVGCFGEEFNQHGKNQSLKNAPDQFLMSDRILSVEAHGGSFGLGYIIAEKDLAPDDWYFPCHFKDDPVLAGSLMAEGCVQLLQFFMLYIGLQTLVEDATFQPIHELSQIVRCRGQVIPGDPKMAYHVEVKEIGLKPHPYAIADIDILAGGRIVVDFRDLGVQLAEKTSQVRVTKNQRIAFSKNDSVELQEKDNIKTSGRELVADEQKIQEFALGDVDKCFGPDFSIFRGRSIQRNPNGDLQLISRVTDLHGTRMEFDKPMTLVSEYDVPKDAWYYLENSHPLNMPYSVLMEIALQPCGFLSTHSGAILSYPELDLCYRNLEGNGTLLSNPELSGKTIVNEVNLLSTVSSGDTIIQTHRFSLSCDGQQFYHGDTMFGYFTKEALEAQVGLDGGKTLSPWIEKNPEQESAEFDLNSSNFRKILGENNMLQHFCLSHGQLSFSDKIVLVPNGGKFGEGYAYASKKINPDDWFFPCHFHQDPVMPGSLGLEAIIQAMQAYAIYLGTGNSFSNPRFSAVLSKVAWKYRGQIIPTTKYMQLELHFKKIIKNEKQVVLTADANLWRENLRIYEISNIVLGISETE